MRKIEALLLQMQVRELLVSVGKTDHNSEKYELVLRKRERMDNEWNNMICYK